MFDLDYARHLMLQRDIAGRGVRAPLVLDAMRRVPREEFVSERLRDSAYEDCPLPIGEGQTISQPYIVALMVEAAALEPGDRVLEIGTGSGYAAAVMATIAGQVHTIERHPSLAADARERLRRLGYVNVEVRSGDGTLGWPEAAPFDAIIAAAGGPEAPQTLKRQLKPGGRLVMPVGRAHDQVLVKLTRTGQDAYREERLCGVRFVPLIGEHGWAVEAPPEGEPNA